MKKLNREILGIALPSVVTNITIPLLGLLDTAIAGHLDASRGALYIGAVSVGATMFNLIYWNFGFLRMGTSGMTAQACGRGDRPLAASLLHRASALALMIALGIVALQVPIGWLVLQVIGPRPEVRGLAQLYFDIGVWGAVPTMLMMALKGWLLGMQNSRAPMVISIGVNVLNIALSLVAVFALGVGFTGIALGTLLSQWLGLAGSVWWLRRNYGWAMRGVNRATLLNWRGARQFMAVNRDIFVRSLLMMLLTLAVTAIGARSGNVVLAANSLIMQLFTLYSYFTDGIAFAGEAVVGKYCGRGDRATLHRSVRALLGWGMALAAVCTVVYAVLPHPIFSLLTSDTTVVDAALRYRWWLAAIPVVSTAAFVWDGVFIGLTRTRDMMVSMAAAVATFAALYAATALWLGNHGLWLAFVAYMAVRSLLQTWQYRQLHRTSLTQG